MIFSSIFISIYFCRLYDFVGKYDSKENTKSHLNLGLVFTNMQERTKRQNIRQTSNLGYKKQVKPLIDFFTMYLVSLQGNLKLC